MTMDTSSSAPWVEWRAAHPQLPVVPLAEIQMVSDDSLCHLASVALDSQFFDPPRAQSVYLARMGTSYATHPPGLTMGEYKYLVVFDSSFHKLVSLGW
ncbi:MAG TPA: hypothetical protein VFS44_00285 [Gemmatimonadaceae bacterium]|nr:hypothetical protein [Gemmatimonadaceae bacterium]